MAAKDWSRHHRPRSGAGVTASTAPETMGRRGVSSYPTPRTKDYTNGVMKPRTLRRREDTSGKVPYKASYREATLPHVTRTVAAP